MTPEQEPSASTVLALPVSRRTALGALAAGAGAVALGLDLGLDGQDALAAGGQFNGAWPYLTPPAGTYNTFVTSEDTLTLGIYGDLMEMPLAMYYWHAKKWLWLMATGGHFAGSNSYVVTLRQGARWNDGSTFTAQDVIDTWTILQALGNPLFDYVDTMHAPNDHTVVFHMKVPSTVVERYVLHQYQVAQPRAHSVYGSWARRFRDLFNSGHTVTSPEVKALRAKLLQFRPRTMVVDGPFRIDPSSITQGQLTLVRNPTSWANHLVKFDRILLYNGETPTVTPVVLAGLVDYATHGFPPATDQEFQRKGFTVLRPPTYYGPAVLPNYAKIPALRNKVARQALLYAVDRAQSGAVGEGKSGVATKYVAGFSDILVPDWLDSATIARLNTYPHDPVKAASLLKSIGWKKGSDGVWVTPDGKKAEWEILAQAEYVDWSATSTNFADQMASFGIKIKVRELTYTQVPIEIGKGDFQLAMQQWGSGDPHPHFSFVQGITYYLPPQTNGPGSGFSLTQKTKDFGTVDLGKMIDDSGLGLDVGKQKALVRQMALIFNDLLPVIPLWERHGNNPTHPGVRVAGWPPPSDPIYLNSPYNDSFVIMMLLTGQLHPA
jgi:peptide/nickel transport system substrate-binding protein